MTTEKLAMNDDDLDAVSGGSFLPYCVQPGDTLGVIAQRFHVTVEQLAKWNNIQNPSLLQVGTQLKVKY